MGTLDLETVDKLLTTTRSVRRRLDFDRPVEKDVILECIDIALQAPSGSNRQGWHFLAITDAEKRKKIGAYYREKFYEYAADRGSAFYNPTDDETRKVADSSQFLAENMGRVPVMIIACYWGRTEGATPARLASIYGSMLPAAWSLMLALRSRGLGAAWTTIHLGYEREIRELLAIPENVTQGVLLPVAYYTGDDFRPAKRKRASEVTFWDSWGSLED